MLFAQWLVSITPRTWEDGSMLIYYSYPYPIFDISVSLRVTLFVVAAFVMTFSTFCLDRLYRALNGKPLMKPEGLRPGNLKRL